MAKNSKIRRRILRTAVPVVAVAVAGTAFAVLRDGSRPAPLPNNYVLTAAADPADGPAYAREAIANVRGLERFRFTQTVTGVSRPQGNGSVGGEIDLSQGSADPPKLRYEEEFSKPGGGPMKLNSVTIGDETFVKGPGKAKHARSSAGPKKSRGKAAGGKPGTADVVDPVMSLLDAVDRLPDDRFGTPSAPDVGGLRTVVVTLGPDARLTLTIDDAERLIRSFVYAQGGVSSTMTLTSFGDAAIVIERPDTD